MKSLSLIHIDLNVSLPSIRPGSNSDHQIAGARSLRLPLQLHTDLIRQLVALAVIAVVAGASGVCPNILATSRLRKDVINREVVPGKWLALEHCAGLYTAVNASVVVPYQYALTAPMRLPARHINVRPQRDNRRNRKLIADSLKEVTGLLNDNRLACQQQIDRARHRNHR